jgi:hypothetical protein
MRLDSWWTVGVVAVILVAGYVAWAMWLWPPNQCSKWERGTPLGHGSKGGIVLWCAD